MRLKEKLKKVNKTLLKKELIALSEEYYKKFKNHNITRSFYRKNTQYANTFEYVFSSFGKFKNEVLKRFLEKDRIEKEKFEEQIKQDSKPIQRINNSITKVAPTIKKKYIVSSIIEGADYNKDFFSALKLYCQKNDAQLVLLWSRGLSKKDAFSKEDFELFKPYLVTEMRFNSKLSSIDFMLFPSQILPLTGLGRFGARDTSLIIASPKQHLESIPRPLGKIPHLLWSTGTISTPSYPRTRAGSLAQQDNILGALVVEVEDNRRFYIRPVQFIKDGFVDLGVKYTATSTKKVKTSVMVWGDLHLGEENEEALQTSIEQAKFLNCPNIILHDLVSLNSINHHNKNKYLTKALVYKQFSTLQQELDYATHKLSSIVSSLKSVKPTFYIVHSNHDNFIKTYLEEGDFVKDTPNAIFAAELFIDMCNDKNPLTRVGGSNKQVVFLPEDATLLFEGINVGLHGSEKSNGGRTNIRTFGRTHDKVIVGHSHSPCIFFGAYQVGTLSNLQLGYNTGTSSWMHANCVVYEGGYRQMITFLDNKWRLE